MMLERLEVGPWRLKVSHSQLICSSLLLRNELSLLQYALNSCWHVVGGKDRCSQARVLVPVTPVETRKCLASAVEGPGHPQVFGFIESLDCQVL